METTASESWCSRQIPKGKIISKFAWQVVTVLCLVTLIDSIIAHENRWWNLSFQDDCENEFILSIYVRTGMCYTSSAVDLSFTECLPWRKPAIWESIDRDTGKDTSRDAKFLFPTVEGLLAALLGIASVQVIVCGLSWRHPESMKGKFRQYLLAFLCTLFFIASYAAGHIGSNSSVTDIGTWDYYHDCSNNISYPAIGYWGNLFAFIFNFVALVILLYPAKFWCFHFISAQEERNAHVVGEIEMADLTRDSSVQYADIAVDEHSNKDDFSLGDTSLNLDVDKGTTGEKKSSFGRSNGGINDVCLNTAKKNDDEFVDVIPSDIIFRRDINKYELCISDGSNVGEI